MWWCPWLHDLAVMVGCIKHGLLNIEAMRLDTALPLSPAAVAHHVSSSLCYSTAGSQGFNARGPCYITSLHSADGRPLEIEPGAVRKWIGALTEQFPTRRALEDRVFAICAILTRDLPEEHPYRILHF